MDHHDYSSTFLSIYTDFDKSLGIDLTQSVVVYDDNCTEDRQPLQRENDKLSSSTTGSNVDDGPNNSDNLYIAPCERTYSIDSNTGSLLSYSPLLRSPHFRSHLSPTCPPIKKKSHFGYSSQ